MNVNREWGTYVLAVAGDAAAWRRGELDAVAQSAEAVLDVAALADAPGGVRRALALARVDTRPDALCLVVAAKEVLLGDALRRVQALVAAQCFGRVWVLAAYAEAAHATHPAWPEHHARPYRHLRHILELALEGTVAPLSGPDAADPDAVDELEPAVDPPQSFAGGAHRVAVRFAPSLVQYVQPDFGVLCGFGAVFPLLSDDDLQGYKSVWELPGEIAGDAWKARAHALVHSLCALLDDFGVRDETFALGPTAEIVGRMMTETRKLHYGNAGSGGGGGASASSAAVVFVDRTLDMVAPSLHTDNFADRMAASLPADGPNLSEALPTWGVQMSGSWMHATSAATKDFVAASVHQRQKEALAALRKALVAAITSEELPLQISGKMGKVTAAQLASFLAAFRGNFVAAYRHRRVLECACAAMQTLQRGGELAWEDLMALEKVLLLSAQDAPEQLLDQLVDAAQTDSKLTLERLAVLGALACSLAETSSPSDAFCELLRRKAKAAPDVDADWILEVLPLIGGARKQLRDYRSLLVDLEYRPLIAQVMHSVLLERTELHDLKHLTVSLGNLLKAGFSRLGLSSSRPRPNAHPLIIVVVLGGITCSEAREVAQIAAQQDRCRVVVLGTAIATGKDVVREVCGVEEESR